MTDNQANFFECILDECGVEYERIEDYSGRAMYGNSTIAYTMEEDPQAVMNELLTGLVNRRFNHVVDECEEAKFEIENFNLRIDNMADDTVYY